MIVLNVFDLAHCPKMFRIRITSKDANQHINNLLVLSCTICTTLLVPMLKSRIIIIKVKLKVSSFYPLCQCFTATPTEDYLRGGKFIGRVLSRSGEGAKERRVLDRFGPLRA
jgi:hypothetical protein